MAKVWNSAVKKRRTLIDMGLDVDTIIPQGKIPEDSPAPDRPSPPIQSASPPVSGFNAEVDDVMIEIQC